MREGAVLGRCQGLFRLREPVSDLRGHSKSVSQERFDEFCCRSDVVFGRFVSVVRGLIPDATNFVSPRRNCIGNEVVFAQRFDARVKRAFAVLIERLNGGLQCFSVKHSRAVKLVPYMGGLGLYENPCDVAGRVYGSSLSFLSRVLLPNLPVRAREEVVICDGILSAKPPLVHARSRGSFQDENAGFEARRAERKNCYAAISAAYRNLVDAHCHHFRPAMRTVRSQNRHDLHFSQGEFCCLTQRRRTRKLFPRALHSLSRAA
jgi:hypothetical protein